MARNICLTKGIEQSLYARHCCRKSNSTKENQCLYGASVVMGEIDVSIKCRLCRAIVSAMEKDTGKILGVRGYLS